MSNLIVLFISNLVTGLISFFISKKISEGQRGNQSLNNLELSVSLFREIIEDLKKEIEGLNIKVQQLEDKIDDLSKENNKLKYGKSI
jgi:peptidoglycan hydrolase CwlO-like protein